MNKLVIFVFVAVIAAVIAEDVGKYTTKYDDVDVVEFLKNKRLLKRYVNCLLEKGPCSTDGNELKKVIPDAIQNGCNKCSEKQQIGGRKFLRHLIDNEPDYWNQLEKKYDPTGEYKNNYKEEGKKEGILLV